MTSTNDPQPTVATTPAKKKSGKGKWIVLGVIGLAVIGGMAATKSGGSSGSPTPSAASATDDLHEVIYHVTGTATSVDITMQDSSGGTSQQSGLAVPLTNKKGEEGLHLKMDDGAFAYISAQNQGDTGTVTCEIEIDGVTVESTTSSGAYVIASCSTLVGI